MYVDQSGAHNYKLVQPIVVPAQAGVQQFEVFGKLEDHLGVNPDPIVPDDRSPGYWLKFRTLTIVNHNKLDGFPLPARFGWTEPIYLVRPDEQWIKAFGETPGLIPSANGNNGTHGNEATDPPVYPEAMKTHGYVVIEKVEFETPYAESWPPPSVQPFLTEGKLAPQEMPSKLKRFAVQAWRGPLSEADARHIDKIWATELAASSSELEALRSSVLTILCDPRFLYLRQANNYDLTARLSYFLWNGPPDQQLTALAAAHAVLDDAMLEQQVDNEGGLDGEGKSNTLSYNQFGRGIPSTNNLRGLYDAMFNSDPALQQKQHRRLSTDQRRVDRVLESYRELKQQLGSQDSQKLEHYMHALRDVEKDIERLELWMHKPKPQVATDGLALDATVQDPETFIRTMYSLIYLAFKTDSTRFASYMLQSMNSSAWDNVPIQMGLGGTHHILAHNAAGGAKQCIPLGKYDKFQGDLLAEFVQKLADTPEPGGSMLDNTIVLYGSSNSQTHVNSDYPMMLIGGDNLGLRHGTFHQLGDTAPPLSNLYLTLLNALDVPATQFSDSSGTLAEIMA